MAVRPTQGSRSDAGVPGVSPEMRKSIDHSYDPAQDGSSPLETTSVKAEEERNVWPIIWALTAIVMILLTIYLIVG